MSIGSFLSGLGGVIPFLEAIVTGVEGVFGSGNGGSKLDAATSAALAALGIFTTLEGTALPANFKADLQAAINAIVQVKNDLGQLLPHTTAAAAAK